MSRKKITNPNTKVRINAVIPAIDFNEWLSYKESTGMSYTALIRFAIKEYIVRYPHTK